MPWFGFELGHRMSVRFGVRVVRFEATDLIVDCRLNEEGFPAR